MNCEYCGAALPANATACPYCGGSVSRSVSAPPVLDADPMYGQQNPVGAPSVSYGQPGIIPTIQQNIIVGAAPTATPYNRKPTVPPTIPTYMVWSILATIFCFLPTGIPAIVYSSKVSELIAAGDYAGAQTASDNAKLWFYISFFLGLIAIVLIAAAGN